MREEMAGNLCRCTGYRGIVRAVLGVLASRRGYLTLGAAAPSDPCASTSCRSRRSSTAWSACGSGATSLACARAAGRRIVAITACPPR